MEAMYKPGRREVGMRVPFLLIRLSQMVLALGLAAVATTFAPDLPRKMLYALVAIGLVVAGGHQFAIATADDAGLYVRRYVKVHFVEWANVKEVNASFLQIYISFRRPVAAWREAAVGFPNLSVNRTFAVLREREELEVLQWIRERIQSAQAQHPS